LQLKIIVAMTASRVIGNAGQLPWKLPEDLRLFRELTWGGVVIMGRRTFASLPAPLPGRTNLVISTRMPDTPGLTIVASLHQALAFAARLSRPVFVIGGARLYRESLPQADELLISWVAGEYPGDVRFPPVYAGDWDPVERRDFPGFCHIRYRRRKNPALPHGKTGLELCPPD